MSAKAPKGDPVLSILLTLAMGLAFGQLVAYFTNTAYTVMIVIVATYWQEFIIAIMQV